MPPFSLLRPAVPFVVALCALLALWAIRALLRWRAVPPGAWLHVELSGAITDVRAPLPRWQRWLGRRASPSVTELRRVLAVAASDPRVAGVLVRFNEIELGWATAESLRDALAATRAQGRRVVAFLPYGGSNKELLVASACSEVYASPPSTIGPLGVSLGSNFFRAMLAKVGIEAEVLARREFKSAAESFTRDGFSPENLRQTEALADALHGALVDALAQGRKLSREDARAFVDSTPVRAREAHAKRVIDGALYDDELLAKLAESSAPEARSEDGFVRLVSFERYARARAIARRVRRKQPRVAIVDVRGPIAVDAPNAQADRVVDVARVSAALRACAKDPAVGAVVLYVDSPGGSALASDLIAREVERLRARKPVVAYFANVAASGGYYVAALADRIVAQPTSITGSIGVVAMRFVVEDAARRAGVTHESVRRGARAELFSPYRRWSDDEREALDRSIDEVYDDFVKIVARGRNMPESQVEPLARGRVYAAKDALAVGLVDELGDLARAVIVAAERAKIDPTLGPVRVTPPRAPQPPIGPATVRAAAAEAIAGEALPWVAFLESSEREQVFLLDERLVGARS
jgi:protease-4